MLTAATLAGVAFWFLPFSALSFPPRRVGARLATVTGCLRDSLNCRAISDELRAAVSMIPAQSEIIPVEGAGHDLKRGRFDFDRVVAALLTSRRVTNPRG